MATHSTGEFGRAEALHQLKARRNWGRWGEDDERGAVNLITPQHLVRAAGLVREGHVVSLSRPFPSTPGPGNPKPALHYMSQAERGDGGHCGDFLGISCHGISSTHMDALCHVWDEDGLYNGHRPEDVVHIDGAHHLDIDQWHTGVITRGVLVDVPRHRGVDFVTQDEPVHGAELAEICAANDIEVRPGDALVVYSGRDAWERDAGRPWGTGPATEPPESGQGADRPGLHASCLEFLRDTDCAALAWDMMDLTPNGLSLSWSVHGAIFAFGIALIDNCFLEELAETCAQRRRREFLLVSVPLRVPGGTGSPANPLAIF